MVYWNKAVDCLYKVKFEIFFFFLILCACLFMGMQTPAMRNKVVKFVASRETKGLSTWSVSASPWENNLCEYGASLLETKY